MPFPKQPMLFQPHNQTYKPTPTNIPSFNEHTTQPNPGFSGNNTEHTPILALAREPRTKNQKQRNEHDVEPNVEFDETNESNDDKYHHTATKSQLTRNNVNQTKQ